MANITTSSCLGFNNDELPSEGHAHMSYLRKLSRVLVDIRSSMNVLPRKTLGKLNTVRTSMKACTLVVRAFYGSKRIVIGKVDLPIMVGTYKFIITFQVMDINPTYCYLIGWPWIHAAGDITFNLHQRLKFIVDDKMIVVEGDEDMFISHLSSLLYIEAYRETLEIPFQDY